MKPNGEIKCNLFATDLAGELFFVSFRVLSNNAQTKKK